MNSSFLYLLGWRLTTISPGGKRWSTRTYEQPVHSEFKDTQGVFYRKHRLRQRVPFLSSLHNASCKLMEYQSFTGDTLPFVFTMVQLV